MYHQVPTKQENCIYTAYKIDGRLYQFSQVTFVITNDISVLQRSIDNIIEEEKLEGTFAYVVNLTVHGRTLEEHDKGLQDCRKV